MAQEYNISSLDLEEFKRIMDAICILEDEKEYIDIEDIAVAANLPLSSVLKFIGKLNGTLMHTALFLQCTQYHSILQNSTYDTTCQATFKNDHLRQIKMTSLV